MAVLRYNTKIGESSAEGRFAQEHAQGTKRPSILAEYVNAGQLLQELGLLHLVNMIDKTEGFHELSLPEKRVYVQNVMTSTLRAFPDLGAPISNNDGPTLTAASKLKEPPAEEKVTTNNAAPLNGLKLGS